jgi:DNA-binding MarR family transcriptional regulator
MNEPETPAIIPALERATHLVALWAEHAFTNPRLTQAEAHALAFLADHAPCAINDLHHHFGHRRSTLTSLLDRLEARGWVRRARHPRSRRLVLLTLTEAGESVAQRAGAATRALEAHVLAQCGPADVAALLRVIHTLEEVIR